MTVVCSCARITPLYGHYCPLHGDYVRTAVEPREAGPCVACGKLYSHAAHWLENRGRGGHSPWNDSVDFQPAPASPVARVAGDAVAEARKKLVDWMSSVTFPRGRAMEYPSPHLDMVNAYERAIEQRTAQAYRDAVQRILTDAPNNFWLRDIVGRIMQASQDGYRRGLQDALAVLTEPASETGASQ